MDISVTVPHTQSDQAPDFELAYTADSPNKETNPNQMSHIETDKEGDDDAISIQTGTDGLLPIEPDSTSPPQEHKLGLDINAIRGWSGSDYDDYDVIAVHGLRDDYKTAWMCKNGNWILRENFFRGMSVREIDYSYEIHENSEVYNRNGIHVLAKELIDKYADERERLAEPETDRPIIWVCHDIGGTIVKQNPAKYGKIFMHTTGIVFIGTPHRFQSQEDLEDQIYKLVLLPGPDVKKKTLTKVKHLAEQIDRINKRFLTTKLLDRACIFNFISQSITNSLADKAPDDESEAADGGNYDKHDWSKTVTPFRRYTHFIGHAFEASGRFRYGEISHLDLIRDEGSSEIGSLLEKFESAGFTLKISYGMIPLQTRLLSLAPPTRSLSIPFDPVLPYPPVLRWLRKQAPCISFEKQKLGPSYLHIYGDGSPLVDISEVSRLLYAHLDVAYAGDSPAKSVIYFEFDQHDSRYNNLSSMLIYLINTILWHFWSNCETLAAKELTFLSDIKSWTVEDLYHIFTKLRHRVSPIHDLTFLIGRFDECSEDQRRWFMHRLLKEQSYSEAPFRIVISTSSSDGLGIDRVTPDRHINLLDCPLFNDSKVKMLEELEPYLHQLITTRPIYRQFIPRIKDVFMECHQMPKLACLVVEWLTSNHRGANKDEIAAIIQSLCPATASNITKVFIEHLPPLLREKAETAFNWIKHAVEPWSADALVEALALHSNPDKKLCLSDLDKQAEMDELVKALGGIITVENLDVKFSHPSFYQVTRLVKDQSPEELVAEVNASMATACLRYFQLESAQLFLDEICLTRLTGMTLDAPLEPFVVYNQRTSTAEYAVRFWAEHYKSSGLSKPKELVRDLFGDKNFRARWEIPFWLLSNPFTRIGRHYISTLPVFAMLGLEDWVDEKITSESDQPWFSKDCWFAITEAIRCGNRKIARKLLDLVPVDEGELQVALVWAAAENDVEIIEDLLAKIPDLKAFEWPKNLIHRATAMGQNSLLSAMLTTGCDVNEVGIYSGAPPVMIAAWRNQVSTLKLLLEPERKPDLSITDEEDDNLVMVATRVGNPDLLHLVIHGGAKVKTDETNGHELAHDEGDDPLLVTAADDGLLECVRILLSHGADPDVEGSRGTALYRAVARGYVEIVRLLLEHNPKPKMGKTPPGEDTILVRAICSGNVELASLLLEHVATVDYIDGNDTYSKTPLSRACNRGNLEMVKLLLEKKADVNYTGGESDPPLFTALYNNRVEVAEYLLENFDPELMWKGPEGMGTLHAAYNKPEILPELLKRGSPIDGMSIWGTALHMAADGGLFETVYILLKNDPKPNLEAKITEDAAVDADIGCTPLQMACKSSSFRCIKVLLEAGANPHVINADGEDVVDILLRVSPGSKDCEKCLRLLVSAPYNVPKERVDEEGRTRLHRIRESTSVDFVRHLTSPFSDLDVSDENGYTPLAVAVSKGNKDVANYLIELGAKINTCSPNYGSILHIAVSNGSIDLVKLLIEAGADREMVDPDYGHGESLMYTALVVEPEGSRNHMVRYLADEAKVSIERLGGALGYPIIRAASMAIRSSKIGSNLLKFFIRRKARLDVTDNQGRRVMHFVAMSRSLDIFKALLRDEKAINAVDKCGRMPIHFAASNSDPSFLEYLLNTGRVVDIDAKDLDHWTPMMWAARSASRVNVRRLLSEKADIWARSLSSDSRDGWSPLKLARFAGQRVGLGELEPGERSRLNHNGLEEVWDEWFHKTKAGDCKPVPCDSCLVYITGLLWKSGFHDLEHNFESIGPLYYEDEDGGSVGSYETKEEVTNAYETQLVSEDDGSDSDNLGLASDN
ncbi:ankyrin repeat [Fusarium beomiforme]|uniref:Ankyrin repeat n=1 Tax=Fusarium beomiforme TaxID=44412 RepID=A0A9P5DTE1_9HYPO|nr:ankyrin repeat [Fusarium beomiforme]